MAHARICAVRIGAVWLSLSLACMLHADPGFGTVRKKKLDLQIRQPAVLRLANVSIAISGTTAQRSFMSALESLVPTLETEMLSNEKSLVKKAASEADYTVALRVTSFSIGNPQQHAVGGLTYVHWTGSLHVAYQVLSRGGRVFDAGNVNYTYDKESPTNTKASILNKVPIPGRKRAKSGDVPQTAEDLKEVLVAEVVQRVAAKLGNTKQTIQVQVAAGEDHMNRAADFMDKQLWSRALDELEKMEPLSKGEAEAYRQYDLGVVHEAMAYEAPTLKDQRANLLQATEYYDKAIEMNRKEKYFVETVARAKDALARYKAFEGMARTDAKPKAPEPPRQEAAQAPARQQPVSVAQATPRPAVVNPPRPQAAPAPVPAAKSAAPQAVQKPPAKVLRASDVIEMFTSGVPEDQITAIVRGSSMQFDPLDKDTAIAIARAKLPVNLQNEMRMKVGAPLLTPPRR